RTEAAGTAPRNSPEATTSPLSEMTGPGTYATSAARSTRLTDGRATMVAIRPASVQREARTRQDSTQESEGVVEMLSLLTGFAADLAAAASTTLHLAAEVTDSPNTTGLADWLRGFFGPLFLVI